jgi:uncharacterized membrane protein
VENVLIRLLSLLFGESVKRHPKLTLAILAGVIVAIVVFLFYSR